MKKGLKLKTRGKFSSLDIRAMVAELNSQVAGCKLNSVFSVNSRTYLIKCGKSTKKLSIVIESGTKVLISSESVKKEDKPNGFCQQLRKIIGSLFVKSVEQVGIERIVNITFNGADQENKAFTFHLMVELYSKGNIVLCNSDYVIVALLRPHVYNDEVKWAVNEPYPFEVAAKYYLQKINIATVSLKDFEDDPKINAGQVVTRVLPFCHQSIVDVCLLEAQIDPSSKNIPAHFEGIMKTVTKIFEIYSGRFGEEGYRYFNTGEDKSFEFSPVSLPYVISLAINLRH